MTPFEVNLAFLGYIWVNAGFHNYLLLMNEYFVNKYLSHMEKR